MQSAVTCVVSVIHLADSVLQTVQHHLLKGKKNRKSRHTDGKLSLIYEVVFGRRTKHWSPTEQTHIQNSPSLLQFLWDRNEGRQEPSVFLCWTNTHSRAQMLHNPGAGAKHIEETKSDSTVLCLPDSVRAHTCMYVCECVCVHHDWAWTPLWQPVTMAGL